MKYKMKKTKFEQNHSEIFVIQNENQSFKMMLKILTFQHYLQNYDHKNHDFVNKVET